LWPCQVFKQVGDFLFLEPRRPLSAGAEGAYFRKG
jgi:hypothetical protein